MKNRIEEEAGRPDTDQKFRRNKVVRSSFNTSSFFERPTTVMEKKRESPPPPMRSNTRFSAEWKNKHFKKKSSLKETKNTWSIL